MDVVGPDSIDTGCVLTPRLYLRSPQAEANQTVIAVGWSLPRPCQLSYLPPVPDNRLESPLSGHILGLMDL